MFSSERVRGFVYQALLLAAVIGLGWYLIGNTLHNLSTRQIQVGFGFLSKEAGFEIAEKLISYEAADSYGRAFLVGLANTLMVAAIGIVFATLLGTFMGIARLSNNWLLAKLAGWYVEVMRNVPLLLQLFVWYGIFTELLPGVREAAVVGVADPVRGEVPVAYLVTDDDLDASAIEGRLRGEIASFKLPRGFVRVDALPRTALGKVQKHLLPPWIR